MSGWMPEKGLVDDRRGCQRLAIDRMESGGRPEEKAEVIGRSDEGRRTTTQKKTKWLEQEEDRRREAVDRIELQRSENSYSLYNAVDRHEGSVDRLTGQFLAKFCLKCKTVL